MTSHPNPVRSTKVPEIRKGDLVHVLSGKDRGKQGRVIDARPKDGKVIVENLNIVKRHTKPRQSAGTTDRIPKMQQGGIMDIAMPIPVSKVMLVCTNCGKPTRIAHATLDTGRRVRVCRHCGEQLEVRS